jgi:uncharacterized membrane protein
MFELLFKYPAAAFSKGDLVLLGRWPVWVLFLLVAAAGALFAFLLWRKRNHAGSFDLRRMGVIWALQTALAGLLLFLLWHPALSVSTLRAQQNVVAVVVDDSKSMSLADGGRSGQTRRDQAKELLDSGLLNELGKKFQVRLYRSSETLQRIEKTEGLNADGAVTRIGDTLKQVAAESASIPLGAVVLLSDGADNSGGLDLDTMKELRRQRVPIHTVGFGSEKVSRDVELVDIQLPNRVLTNSRLNATVSFQQTGYKGGKGRLTLKDGSRVVASQEVTFRNDGETQTESISFNAGIPGARTITATIEPGEGEQTPRNNALNRLVMVEDSKPRVLYIEGEPRWEYKFIRRAVEEDGSILVASMLRTTQNKIYRQGISEPGELEQGFPTTVEELFKYQGLVIGGVEAGYFNTQQQELIRLFADRRGGGVLFLGGRSALADGGYAKSGIAEMLPVNLPDRKQTFFRDPANVELAPAGRDSLITRLEEDPAKNAERWSKLPYLANYQDPGTAKPGAVVLAEMNPGGRGKMPLLVIQNYGRGRTGVLATGGTWRWQMTQPLEDKSHELFWQQLMRWLVAGSNSNVTLSTPRSVYSDENRVQLRAEVRDKAYLPASDAAVEARVLGPNGSSDMITMQPDPNTPGVYTADYTASVPGSYVVDVSARRGDEEAGRDALTFSQETGVAENFHIAQNRELLEKVATQTGGRYYKPSDASRLPEEITYSEAGISTRETRDLWDMPVLFLAALLLRSAEWFARRKWGAI